MDLLKVDVPCDATPETPWEVTRLSHQAYFVAVRPKRELWDQPETVGYRRIEELSGSGAGDGRVCPAGEAGGVGDARSAWT